MKIISFSGEAGSGKDTAYSLLSEFLEEQNLNTTKISFANRLKDCAALMLKWDRERLDSDLAYKEGDTLDDGSPDPACQFLGMTRRVFMQRFGTEAMRDAIHTDFWIITTKLDIMNGEYENYSTGFITDARFFNELQFVKDMGGITVLIEPSETDNGLSKTKEGAHVSEQEWRQWTDWDIIVNNPYDPSLSKEENLKLFKEVLIDRVFTELL